MPVDDGFVDAVLVVLAVLIVSTLICVTFTLVLAQSGFTIAIVCFIIANIAYQAGLQFYDALLPEVSTEQNRGRIGGIGRGFFHFLRKTFRLFGCFTLTHRLSMRFFFLLELCKPLLLFPQIRFLASDQFGSAWLAEAIASTEFSQLELFELRGSNLIRTTGGLGRHPASLTSPAATVEHWTLVAP